MSQVGAKDLRYGQRLTEPHHSLAAFNPGDCLLAPRPAAKCHFLGELDLRHSLLLASRAEVLGETPLTQLRGRLGVGSLASLLIVCHNDTLQQRFVTE